MGKRKGFCFYFILRFLQCQSVEFMKTSHYTNNNHLQGKLSFLPRLPLLGPLVFCPPNPSTSAIVAVRCGVQKRLLDGNPVEWS